MCRSRHCRQREAPRVEPWRTNPVSRDAWGARAFPARRRPVRAPLRRRDRGLAQDAFPSESEAALIGAGGIFSGEDAKQKPARGRRWCSSTRIDLSRAGLVAECASACVHRHERSAVALIDGAAASLHAVHRACRRRDRRRAQPHAYGRRPGASAASSAAACPVAASP